MIGLHQVANKKIVWARTGKAENFPLTPLSGCMCSAWYHPRRDRVATIAVPLVPFQPEANLTRE